MPVTYNLQPEHRERLKSLYWDKLGHVTTQQLALVARLVSQAEQKWKGRSVFHKVSDENDDHAIFAELGSSPASMEAAKIIDVFGSQPGYSTQQADARQAYTQALFTGIETWVCLPRNRWPKEWNGMKDPVCPLRLALYGHPDSGGIWEQRCTKQLGTVGWVAVLPEIWQSILYHAELDLLLVVYVDDFKMAGPEANLAAHQFGHQHGSTRTFWMVR